MNKTLITKSMKGNKNKRLLNKINLKVSKKLVRCAVCASPLRQDTKMDGMDPWVFSGAHCPKCKIKYESSRFPWRRIGDNRCCGNHWTVIEIGEKDYAICVGCGRTWELKKETCSGQVWVETLGGRHESQSWIEEVLGEYVGRVECVKNDPPERPNKSFNSER